MWFVTAELMESVVGGFVLVAMDTELVLVDATVTDGLVTIVVLVDTADVESTTVADEVRSVMVELLLSVDSNVRVEFTVRLAAALKKGLSEDGSLVVGSPCALAHTRRITEMTTWRSFPLLLTDILHGSWSVCNARTSK